MIIQIPILRSNRPQLNLFSNNIDFNSNLLPCDGEVNHFNSLLDRDQADYFFRMLTERISWENDRIQMFGKQIITKRKVAWYGDRPFSYIYSHTAKFAKPWTEELKELKFIIENSCRESFNSCLLNLYHSGEEGMSWHSDNEPELKKDASIASLSLGADRKFVFRHKKTLEKREVLLENGSLLLMRSPTQEHWQHCLPVTKKCKSPRINLTFRNIISL